MENESLINQRICSKLVDREVIYCVSSMVHELASLGQSIGDWTHEEIMDLCRIEPDCEEILFDHGYTLVEEDGQWHIVEQKYADHFSYLIGRREETTDEEDASWLDEQIDEHSLGTVGYGSAEEAVEELGIDKYEYEREVFEHWIVSDFLARQLKAKGETVGDLFGMTIWGRGCTGQAIAMDSVIEGIARDMEILYGQRHDWSKQGE